MEGARKNRHYLGGGMRRREKESEEKWEGRERNSACRKAICEGERKRAKKNGRGEKEQALFRGRNAKARERERRKMGGARKK